MEKTDLRIIQLQKNIEKLKKNNIQMKEEIKLNAELIRLMITTQQQIIKKGE